jgi:hypothetical protein
MSYGHYRNSGITPIKSYAQALAQWEMTKPIRGRKEELRPLGNRKNTWYALAKNDKGDIECKLYDTPLVTFTTDNNIIIHNLGYITTSTSNFIEDVLHHQGIATYIKDFSLVVGLRDSFEDEVIEQRLGRGEKLTIIRDAGDRNYHFAKIKPEATHVINRKQTNIVRKKYAGFKDYMRQVCLLRNDEIISRQEVVNATHDYASLNLASIKYQGVHYTGSKTLISGLQDINKWLNDTSDNKHEGYYKLLMMLVYSFGEFAWSDGGGHKLRYDKIEQGLDKLIMGFNRDECFTAKPTEGGVKRDTYREYFTGIWNEVHNKQAYEAQANKVQA